MTPAIVENAYQDSFSSRSKVTLGRQVTEKAAKKNLLMQRNLKPCQIKEGELKFCHLANNYD